MPAPSALRIAFRGIAQRAVVAGRRSIVIDLRPDLRRIIGRLFGNRLPPRRVLGMEPLTLVERLVELADDGLAVADQRHFGRLVVADLLGRDVELHDLDVLRVARRQAEMKHPIESRAHQEDHVGLLQRQRARCACRQRMVVRHHALAHR